MVLKKGIYVEIADVVRDIWEHFTEDQEFLTTASLFEGDLGLRDGLALHLFERHIRSSGPITFVHPWDKEKTIDNRHSGNLLFLGRAELFKNSEFSSELAQLSPIGEFRDATENVAGDLVRYGSTTFTRHVIAKVPYRRSVLDYGVLRYCEELDTGRRFINIGGLGVLGTLGLMIILVERSAREKLANEVIQLLKDRSSDIIPNPKKFELCVRISAGNEEGLSKIIRYASNPSSDSFPFESDLHHPFLAAVAWQAGVGSTVSRVNMKATAWRINEHQNRSGGEIFLHNGTLIPLSKLRYALIKLLSREPRNQSYICRELGYKVKGDWKNTPLPNLISATNKHLHEYGTKRRPIRTDRKTGLVEIIMEE